MDPYFEPGQKAPPLMHFPLAVRYMEAGYAVRLATWDGSEGGEPLAWLTLQGNVFLYHYEDSGEVKRRVVTSADFTAADYRRNDFTTLMPGCGLSGDADCPCSSSGGLLALAPFPESGEADQPAFDLNQPNLQQGIFGCDLPPADPRLRPADDCDCDSGSSSGTGGGSGGSGRTGPVTVTCPPGFELRGGVCVTSEEAEEIDALNASTAAGAAGGGGGSGSSGGSGDGTAGSSDPLGGGESGGGSDGGSGGGGSGGGGGGEVTPRDCPNGYVWDGSRCRRKPKPPPPQPTVRLEQVDRTPEDCHECPADQLDTVVTNTFSGDLSLVSNDDDARTLWFYRITAFGKVIDSGTIADGETIGWSFTIARIAGKKSVIRAHVYKPGADGQEGSDSFPYYMQLCCCPLGKHYDYATGLCLTCPEESPNWCPWLQTCMPDCGEDQEWGANCECIDCPEDGEYLDSYCVDHGDGTYSTYTVYADGFCSEYEVQDGPYAGNC